MDRKIVGSLTLLLTLPVISLAIPDAGQVASEIKVTKVPDKRIVDCLLQGQIRKLGNTMYQMPPRPVSIPAIDCEIRGGDMLVFDRANFATSLSHWLGLAKQGDVNAQIYVGEIFERGLGREPDFAQAAAWYARAAKAGNPVAQISLAQLYEKGLGVEKNAAEAERLYALAFGADSYTTVEIDSGTLDDPGEKIRELEQSLAAARQESNELSGQLQVAQVNLLLAEKDLAEQEGERELLQQSLAAQESRADKLSGDELLEAKKQLAKSNAELAATQFTITQLNKEVQRNERQLSAYQEELDRVQELEQALASQSREFDAVNQELRQARLALAESNNRLADQENEINQERSSIDQAREELATETQMSAQMQEELRLTIKEREERLQTQESILSNMQGEMEIQRQQSRDLQNRLTELRAENDRLVVAQADADRFRQESNRLELALAETQSQLALIEAAVEKDELGVAQANADAERYRREAEEYKARLEKIEADLEANAEMTGPSIQLVDPLAHVTRGTRSDVSVRSESEQQIVGKVVAPAGLISLHVNNESTQLNERNVFTRVIPITGRETPVTIVAIDNQGKRVERLFSLINENFTPPGPDLPDVEFGRYHALLIGNEEYAKLPDLQTPINDISSIGKILRERYNYETTVIHDGTREEIMDGMYNLLSKLNSEDNLLIYYAGHGEYVTDTNRGVWLPIDASPNSPANWITNVEINDYLKQIRAKQIVVIADSCYSGSLTRSAIVNLRPGLTDDEYEAHLQKMSKIRARVVLTSGGLAPVLDSANPESQNSIFAAALIEILNQNKAILSAQDLGRTIAAKVSLAATRVGYEQEPQYAPLSHANHQGGDFFFVPMQL